MAYIKNKLFQIFTFAFYSHLDSILVHIRENTQGSTNSSTVAQVWNADVNWCQHSLSHLFRWQRTRIVFIWSNMFLCWTFFLVFEYRKWIMCGIYCGKKLHLLVIWTSHHSPHNFLCTLHASCVYKKIIML